MRDRMRKRTSNITGMSSTDLVRMIIVRMIVMMIFRTIDMVKIEKNTHRVVFN